MQLTRIDPGGLSRLTKGRPVALAMSGGVDSSVAARILLDRGCRVLAFHLVLFPQSGSLTAAQEAADLLGLRLRAIDLSGEFDRLIIEPFIKTYAAGRTPSPCVACNPAIKFGLLWQRARELGAAALATGHYAGLVRTGRSGQLSLSRPRDRQKDQTYFLCRLTPDMIGRAVFPLADLTKEQVKEQAADLGLRPRSESQEICFLAGRDYRELIRRRLGPQAFKEGDLVDLTGRKMGRHKGLIHYTVGQRRGLGVPGPEPYYVLALDAENNRVIIGPKEQTLARGFLVRDLILHQSPETDCFPALAQIRSRHRPAPARIRLLPSQRAQIVFEQPQSAITAGQAVALYQDHLLLGGGWIEQVDL